MVVELDERSSRDGVVKIEDNDLRDEGRDLGDESRLRAEDRADAAVGRGRGGA